VHLHVAVDEEVSAELGLAVMRMVRLVGRLRVLRLVAMPVWPVLVRIVVMRLAVVRFAVPLVVTGTFATAIRLAVPVWSPVASVASGPFVLCMIALR
jgi:hypothetical protein